MSKLDGEMLGHLNTVGQLHLLFSSLLLLSTSGVIKIIFNSRDKLWITDFHNLMRLWRLVSNIILLCPKKNNHRKNMTATCTFRGISL